MDSAFNFKQFRVGHDRCAMKVGTDGVLLGAWADIGNTESQRILDIGTGSGVIALMLAQRFPGAVITGIDPDVPSIEQAAENFAASPWSSRLKAVCTTLQGYRPECTFDLIVSNPPYYDPFLTNPDERKTAARHTCSLSHDDLLEFSERLLSEKGQLCVVIPADIGRAFLTKAEKQGLYPVRLTPVFTTAVADIPKRLLATFGKTPLTEPMRCEPLCLTNPDNSPTEALIGLTKDFYLNF